MLKLLLFLLLSQINAFAQKNKCVTKAEDTLSMIVGTQAKYWDKVDNPPYYGKIKVINEGWYLQRKPLTLLKYKYSKSNTKKRYEPIEIDLLIGKLSFILKNDTIIIPQLDSKILIKKITNDTLVVHDISGGLIGDAMFVKSKDQTQKLEPAIKTRHKESVKIALPSTSICKSRASPSGAGVR